MADGRSIVLDTESIDKQQLQLEEAQHRWFRPVEIYEIPRKYQKYQISSEPPNRPPSGSVFLFDRKVLRNFQKDGHNWKKKRHGMTVKESDAKLRVGSVEVLHCYYAHGEENECFQRRSYWLLDKEPTHIVFVHYLEVKGDSSSTREREPVISNSQLRSPLSKSVLNSYNGALVGNTGSLSAANSLYELANTAAVRIQKKFRGWTKRKEFLIIREWIFKIQLYVCSKILDDPEYGTDEVEEDMVDVGNLLDDDNFMYGI